MLLTHGARSVLRAASVAQHQWQERFGASPVVAGGAKSQQSQQGDLCAGQQDRAICYATLRDGEHYRDLGANPNARRDPERKLNRESFAMPG